MRFPQVDSDLSGSIDFGEFIRVIEKQKERASKFSDESDMIDAYVACGGNEDKSGFGEPFGCGMRWPTVCC